MVTHRIGGIPDHSYRESKMAARTGSGGLGGGGGESPVLGFDLEGKD